MAEEKLSHGVDSETSVVTSSLGSGRWGTSSIYFHLKKKKKKKKKKNF